MSAPFAIRACTLSVFNASAEVDEMVPVGLYVAVAEILAFVFKQRSRGRAGLYAQA